MSCRYENLIVKVDYYFFSAAVVGIEWGLAILLITFLGIFILKKFITAFRLCYRDRKRCHPEDGKSLDVFVCGTPDDLELMEQLKLDLSNFGYSVQVTSASLFENNQLSEEFLHVVTDVRCLVYVFSSGIIKKIGKTISTKSESHEWFNKWFDKGIEQIQIACAQNGIKNVIVTVYNKLEGHKAVPTPTEQKIKEKIEAGLSSANHDCPIIEFSREYQEVLRLKEKSSHTNPNGLYNIDSEYRKSVDKLRLQLHAPIGNSKTVDLEKQNVDKTVNVDDQELCKLVDPAERLVQ